jgi:broad specificity phosphatase PhoE
MIYIVRHGQTAWNLQKRKQGQKDSPLTLKGIQQAKDISVILKNETSKIEKFDFVVSPQWRCQQFASILCELNNKEFSKCIFEEKLREHSFGLWEGKTEEEIENVFPGFLQKRYKPENYWSYIVPKGESYELLYNRVGEVVDKYREKNIVFICHEMVSKVMRGYVLKLKPDEILPLKHKQNIVYRIDDGKLEAIKVENPK